MVWALCSALLFITPLSNAQPLVAGSEYSTNNIVTNTNGGGPSSWQNGVYQDNLTCWAWGNPGYCGPNPIVRTGNVINFSFGVTDLHQVHAISNVLPNSGTGLRVNGYTFSFSAKNGNGWDDGRVDQLSAYVTVYGANGSIVHNKSYNLNYKFDWTPFNFNETFNSPILTKDLSNVRYGFIGGDNNFWAGPYGPEIYNISFSLRYSVDPCSVDVMSSPSCPGYLNALMKLTTIEPVTSTSTETSVSFATTVENLQTPLTKTYGINSNELSTQTLSTNQQTRAVEATATNSQNRSPSTSQILSIIRGEQKRIGSLETSVSQQAIEQAQSASDKTQQESVSISSSTISQSSSSQNKASSLASYNVETMNQNENSGTINQSTIARTQNIYSLTSTQQTQTISPVSSQIYFFNNRNESFKIQDEPTRGDGIKFNSTDPIYSIINTPPTQSSTQESVTTAVVNTKVKDNDVAGGISIETISKQPRGFESYMGVIPDVAFYKSEEIYRRQVTVDNVRLLRQLSSDRLHQEMVNQQYRK